MATETEAIYRQRSSPSLTHRNLERRVRPGKLLIALNSIPERKHEGPYLSFGNLLPELLLAIVILAGCVEMPVSVRAPYGAASPSYSAPWQPPPAVTVNRVQLVTDRRTPVPVDPNAVYGIADLIDFAHRSNPETRRAWEAIVILAPHYSAAR